jgi:hypothetical protein
MRDIFWFLNAGQIDIIQGHSDGAFKEKSPPTGEESTPWTQMN